MSTITTTDLHSQLSSFEIDPALTECLARIRCRTVAQRLWASDDGLAGDSRRDVVWLHPRDVWTKAAPPPAARIGQHPALEHLPGPQLESWCAESVATLERDVKRVDPSQSLTLSERLTARSRAKVEQALAVLRRLWPEAAYESHLLVRAIVYVDSELFRSATLNAAFGAIYAGRSSLTSVPAAFEMLLHETGHHALYLRTFFDRLVTNGTHLASHPLRPDPRPISGVLHSAHVLARMATGLTRWAQESGAPQETGERADQAVERLAQSLDVLEHEARWTERGEVFFANLSRAAKALPPVRA
jgi:hypothetical protein